MWRALIPLLLLFSPLHAAEISVAAGQGALQPIIDAARPGDVVTLAPGLYEGPVTLNKPLTLQGQDGAKIDGAGTGSVITVDAADVVVRGLTITGSGDDHEAIDSGVQLTRAARGAVVENNVIRGNLYGIDIHGARNAVARGNVIEGRQDRRMNDRGNGIYVWNAPGAVVERNDIRWGRDGVFVNASQRNIFRDNLFRDLRFAVHYMYTHDSEVAGNVSVGNHLGYAIMYSDRVQVLNNISLRDRDHGVMLNFANGGDVVGNLVRGGAEKCSFIYNSHQNLIANNRFEGCDIGIHFTAGSERNGITGNAFIGSREQVKYVGTKDVEWSVEGRGNYWSDNAAFDLNGDSIGDSPYRPNDLMDHILWSQPAAAALIGSPAVQLIRWSQSSFPAVLPGGVVDSFPLLVPVAPEVTSEVAALEQAARPPWLKE
ncbi:nitrous oxide reductase family maturation protein NosD [Paracoccus sp. SCSIO 75233]|uniref:nitrous oxide reductase family maturation protein NosD n=1 Tax=Paracoccus sp. SCSIO 75233 TaxID=3017782 RepID=UPI0022F07B44|nr:nitrous oxide reductase family maturation protein NosD [Paracoccus sp. SCSIO 75233]WBU55220.1 nitrous oxide reductase family maturation protein NosD [Paracoccus sp. SCSIO 75233]